MDKWILIYESWLKLFKQYWPKKVSIDMIVKDADVGKGTFYNYYKNKEELYEIIVSDIIKHWKEYMGKLIKLFPDPKERLMIDFLNSLDFFCSNNGIIWNLMHWNKDFFLWNIDENFLDKTHKEMSKILFSDIIDNVFENDEELLSFCRDLFWLYKHATVVKHHFENDKDFKNFMAKLAYFFIEWIFDKKLKKIKDINYIDYNDKLEPFKWGFDFMKKY